MKKFLAFGTTYLLLAAFIGSAEAKKFDSTDDAGADFFQLAIESDSRIFQTGQDTGWALGEPDSSIKLLLALYDVEDISNFIAVKKISATSKDEDLSTNEYEEDFTLGEETLFGDNPAGFDYGNRLENQTVAATIVNDPSSSISSASAGGDSTVPNTVSGSASENVPAIDNIPTAYLDPPTTVYTEEPTQSKNQQKDSEKTSGSSPEQPQAVSPSPAADVIPADDTPSEDSIATVIGEESTQSKNQEKDSEKTPGSSPEKQSQAVSPSPDADVIPADDTPAEVISEQPTQANKKKSKTGKTSGSSAEKQPKAVSPSPDADVIPPDVDIPSMDPIFADSSPDLEYSEDDLAESLSIEITYPDDSTISSPAPVPEPATMLLFSTGIAGLAFSRLRRNKNNDQQKKV